MIFDLGSRYYANNDTLAVAGTQQRLAAGAETQTFVGEVKTLVVLHVDLDTYIAKTSALVLAAAGGAEDDRILIQADQHMVMIPWFSNDVWFLNAVAAQTPTIGVIGIP